MDIKDLDIGVIEDYFSMARYNLSKALKVLKEVSDIDNSLLEISDAIIAIEEAEDSVVNTLKRNR